MPTGLPAARQWPGATGGSGPGSLDLTFDPTLGGERVGLTGGSPIVHTVLQQPDGRVLIGGWFNGVNGRLRNNLARLNTDGSLDPTFQPGFGTDGRVLGLALRADGKIVVIGEFRTVNAQPHPLIARLNSDGSVDETFNCRLAGDPNLRLTGAAVQPSGKIWIGGQFTNVNGVARLNLARLNADGSLDLSFDPESAIAGTNRYVEDLQLQPDGKLLVSGAWGSPARSLVRLNVDGALDAGFANVVVSDPIEFYRVGSIRDISCNSNGAIVIAGYFWAVNGTARQHVARLHPDGTLDTSFAPAQPDYNFLWAVTMQPDGKVVIGGNFAAVNGIERKGVARLNADGSVDTAFDPGNAAGVPAGYYAHIYALSSLGDGGVLVAAAAWWGHENTNTVFRLENTGRREPAFAPLLHAPVEGVGKMALQPDGEVIFGTFGSYTRSTLVRLNPNGLIDESFVPGTNFGFFHAVTLQPDGKILVASASETEPQLGSVVRLHSDGSLDENFHAPNVIGGEAPIETLALQPDGKILVGGLVWQVEGHPHQGIVRLHPDGSFDLSFQPVPIAVTDDPGYGVEHIFVLPGGKILIIGGFTRVTGGAAGILLLESDGTVDEDFAANVAKITYAYDAARQVDGKILVGVYSPEAGVGVIRINPDGTDDATFHPALTGEFYALAVQMDGRILLATGLPEDGHIVRLNPDGSLDPAFQAETYPWGVHQMLLQADGQVLVAGGFHGVNGVPMHGIARLNNEVTWRVDAATPTAPGQFRFMITGRPGVRLTIEASTDLRDWTPLGEVTTGPDPVPFVDPIASQFSRRFYRTREER